MITPTIHDHLMAVVGGLSQHALRALFFAVIDSAARPAIYYRHGKEGRILAKSGDSTRHGKSKSHSLCKLIGLFDFAG
jgi:hypothetical protein